VKNQENLLPVKIMKKVSSNRRKMLKIKKTTNYRYLKTKKKVISQFKKLKIQATIAKFRIQGQS